MRTRWALVRQEFLVAITNPKALLLFGLPDGWAHWLLVRQQITPTDGRTRLERAYYRWPRENPAA